ncbi:conserved protein of unknown function (plasmid) [Rhodovastum atsumiense]|uniref:Calcineurin-like phosphoesterase domain-containing protein n=1 Tax=Rhodovastum atsumiense TaxID=504468 RepID=A0A5M6IP11_9PROT|nr:hypothetical protein [Rhodovastum atsumiense]KAA5609639.1 hypothetical protein F1189_23030 [Rhodovastum atsumiense]CAH2606505.1 conserved protein of unknown function [Rhodovastum atsumiense]
MTDDVQRAAGLHKLAVAEGAVPMGQHVCTGRRSAVWEVAERAGWTRNVALARLREAERQGLLSPPPADFEVPDLPDENPDVDALIEARTAAFRRKQVSREARRLIPVTVRLDGPIGILHMGDPHVDDDGCDWPRLRRHVDLAQTTKGLLAGNAGDMTNNWVGRLARLYAAQSTTAAQAWKLAEWFIGAVPWLYLIGGNHDAWSGDGDPVKWMAKQAGVPYETHGARLALHLPNGREIRVNARHDFRGASQWNPAHGPGKAAQLGPPDHIFVCGHKHVFGQGWHRQPNGVWSCALRVGTYKVFDGYADALGFPEHNLPAVVTLIFPDADEEGLIEVVKDPERAAEFLTWARARHAAGKTVRPCEAKAA